MSDLAPIPVSGRDGSAPVLAGRELRPGTAAHELSLFDQDKWVLTPALLMKHAYACSVNFALIPPSFRQVAKEYIFALLTMDDPAGVASVGVKMIRSRFGALKEFLLWAEARGITLLGELAAADLEAYRDHIEAQRIGQNAREEKRRAVRSLWLYRAKLHSDTLTLDPGVVWGLPYARRSSSTGAGENATERIPEQVLNLMVGWALRFTEQFADDILRLAREKEELDWETQKQQFGTSLPRPQAGARLTALLDRYRAEGRMLPGQTEAFARRFGSSRDACGRPVGGGVNIRHLAREARISRNTLTREPYRGQIQRAAAELGFADSVYLRTVPRGELDGAAWHGPVRWDEVGDLTRHLHTACYIVIAYLSGMRDSETKHLERGCMSVRRDETGRVVRHRITSLAFKSEDDPAGVEAQWTVTAPVARAAQVAEQIQPAGQDLLFAMPPAVWGDGNIRERAILTGATNTDMARFVDWINAYCHARHRLDAIPEVNGEPWRLTTRQWRRTLAWFIARQPGGTIAGAIQYRHLSLQMFEGYAGSSASGFRHEVQAEQAIARGEKLVDLVTDAERHQLTGPAGAEAESRLAAFNAHAQFTGKVVPDRKRLERHLGRHDPHVYPGEIVTCVYNPDRALCRRTEEHGPHLADCQPLACRNAAFTANNTEALRTQLAATSAALRSALVLAPYVRHRLQQQEHAMTTFLDKYPTTGQAGS